MSHVENMRRDAVGITIEGDIDTSLAALNIMAKYFTFGGNKISMQRGDYNTAKFYGIIDGRRKKKYRKAACVAVYDTTDED